MISDADLKSTKSNKARSQRISVEGFSPETDLVDRRLLYDVTGIHIIENEFMDTSSADSGSDADDSDQGGV